MTNLLFWLIYYVDLGPLGPKLMDFAVRTWLIAHRPKAKRAEAGWALTPAWTHR